MRGGAGTRRKEVVGQARGNEGRRILKLLEKKRSLQDESWR